MTDSFEYAKAFYNWLPGTVDRVLRKSDNNYYVQIAHYNERVGAMFDELYTFYDDGTFSCHASAFPFGRGPDNDFGDGFNETKLHLSIDKLSSISRILANVKNGLSRLDELKAAFEKISSQKGETLNEQNDLHP